MFGHQLMSLAWRFLLRADALLELGFAPISQPTRKEIRDAYKDLALKLHPDKVCGRDVASEAADRFIRLQAAFEFLLRTAVKLDGAACSSASSDQYGPVEKSSQSRSRPSHADDCANASDDDSDEDYDPDAHSDEGSISGDSSKFGSNSESISSGHGELDDEPESRCDGPVMTSPCMLKRRISAAASKHHTWASTDQHPLEPIATRPAAELPGPFAPRPFGSCLGGSAGTENRGSEASLPTSAPDPLAGMHLLPESGHCDLHAAPAATDLPATTHPLTYFDPPAAYQPLAATTVDRALETQFVSHELPEKAARKILEPLIAAADHAPHVALDNELPVRELLGKGYAGAPCNEIQCRGPLKQSDAAAGTAIAQFSLRPLPRCGFRTYEGPRAKRLRLAEGAIVAAKLGA